MRRMAGENAASAAVTPRPARAPAAPAAAQMSLTQAKAQPVQAGQVVGGFDASAITRAPVAWAMA